MYSDIFPFFKQQLDPLYFCLLFVSTSSTWCKSKYKENFYHLQIFMENIFLIILSIYLFLCNIYTFWLRWWDKYAARKTKTRISEKKLLQQVWLWWGIWALLGMEIRRHKTIKWTFLKKFWTILLCQALLLSIWTYLLFLRS